MGASLVDGPVDGVEGSWVACGEGGPEGEWVAERDTEGLRADKGTTLDADGIHNLGDASLGRIRSVVGCVEWLAGWWYNVFVLLMVSVAVTL